MTFNVCGVRQDRLVELGLDIVDAAIIDWFKIFSNSGNMHWRPFGKNGGEPQPYFLIRPSYLSKQMPSLMLKSRQAVWKRLKRLAEKEVFNVAVYAHDSGSGPGKPEMYFSAGPNYSGLFYVGPSTQVDDKDEKHAGPSTQVDDDRQRQLTYSLVLDSKDKEGTVVPLPPVGEQMPFADPDHEEPVNGNGNGHGKNGDATLKPLILYFSKEHLKARGFEPTIKWPRDMAIMKELRKEYDEGAIKQLVGLFFDPKIHRLKTGLRDFAGKADMLYGIAYDQARGKL